MGWLRGVTRHEERRGEGSPGLAEAEEPQVAPDPARRPGRRARHAGRWALFLLVTLAVTAGLCWVRWQDSDWRTRPDTYWYAYQAVVWSGAGPQRAAADAGTIVCADRQRSARLRHSGDGCPSGYRPNIWSSRYIRIFTTRPGYPALAAPLVKGFGAGTGMMLATMAAALAVGLLLAICVRELTGSPVAGVVAAALLLALPSGFWLTRLMPEGAMLAGYLLALLGMLRAARGRWGGYALVAVGLAWTLACKSANGVTLAVVVVLGAGLWARRIGWRRAAALGGLGLVALVGWFVLQPALGLPGTYETVQDLATRHFARPDIPDPLTWLFWRDVWFLPRWVWHLLVQVWPLPLAMAGLIALGRRCGLWSAPLLLAGLTGVALVAAHPLNSETNRLAFTVWLAVAAGLAALLPVVVRKLAPSGAPLSR